MENFSSCFVRHTGVANKDYKMIAELKNGLHEVKFGNIYFVARIVYMFGDLFCENPYRNARFYRRTRNGYVFHSEFELKKFT